MTGTRQPSTLGTIVSGPQFTQNAAAPGGGDRRAGGRRHVGGVEDAGGEVGQPPRRAETTSVSDLDRARRSGA